MLKEKLIEFEDQERRSTLGYIPLTILHSYIHESKVLEYVHEKTVICLTV